MAVAVGAGGRAFLLSPLGMLTYNGSCEAGIGLSKTRAHHPAAGHGRPGGWGGDDVEAARAQANETARTRGQGSYSALRLVGR